MHPYLHTVRGVVSAPAMVLALAMAMSLDAIAQSVRYPWDRRPEICFGESPAKDSACELDNWPNFSETVNRITFLYRSEQFALLDRAMADAISTERRFGDGTTRAQAVYEAFKTMMPGPGTQPSHQGKIGRWQNAVPDSPFAVFAQARFSYGAAWNFRGNQYASSVSKESWELFDIRLTEAEQALLD